MDRLACSIETRKTKKNENSIKFELKRDLTEKAKIKSIRNLDQEASVPLVFFINKISYHVTQVYFGILPSCPMMDNNLGVLKTMKTSFGF